MTINCSDSGVRPSRNRRPISLSTALCRPHTLYAPAITDADGNRKQVAQLPSDLLFVTVDELDQNLDPGVAETVSVVLVSTGTGNRERINLLETDPDGGTFRNVLGVPFVPSSGSVVQNDGVLEGAVGSFVLAFYADPDYAGDRSFVYVPVR